MKKIIEFISRHAILSIAVTCIATWLFSEYYKDTTSLTLSHISTVSLPKSTKTLSDLKLIYKNKPVNDLKILSFTMTNDGNTAIKKADIASPPSLRFDDKTTLLEARQEEAPPLITSNVSWDPALPHLKIDFDLLNPGESIRFSVFIDGDPSFKYYARIANAHLNLLEPPKEPDPKTSFFASAITACAAILILGLIAYWEPVYNIIKKLYT